MTQKITQESFSIEAGLRIYAIGDIHGYAAVLDRLHAAIDAHAAQYPVERVRIVYVGDYIDRGPDSAEVLESLIGRELERPDISHVFLKGNHENGMLQFIDDPDGARQDWLQWGGLQTLLSYGIVPDLSRPFSRQLTELAIHLKEALPPRHHEFLKNLQLMHVAGDYVFVHAGIRPGVALEQQKDADLMIIREPFLSHKKPQHGKRVVHGHTITRNRRPEILPGRINIDTGLYAEGPLTCLVLEGDSHSFLHEYQDGRSGKQPQPK